MLLLVGHFENFPRQREPPAEEERCPGASISAIVMQTRRDSCSQALLVPYALKVENLREDATVQMSCLPLCETDKVAQKTRGSREDLISVAKQLAPVGCKSEVGKFISE